MDYYSMGVIGNSLLKISAIDLDIIYFQVFYDNYVYMLLQGGKAAVVDPGAAGTVITYLEKYDLSLTHIFCTHSHYDHVGGVRELKIRYGCTVYGPHDSWIPALDRPLSNTDRVLFNNVEMRVLSVPGHTRSHVAYYAPEGQILFTGDCLFLGGCGRIFEGTAKDMYNSLQVLGSLPDSTQIFPGHEYTQENLEFTLSLEPENTTVSQRLAKVRRLRRKNIPTVPGLLSEEKVTNPFLRVHEHSLRKTLHMENASDAEVFVTIRKLKDRF